MNDSDVSLIESYIEHLRAYGSTSATIVSYESYLNRFSKVIAQEYGLSLSPSGIQNITGMVLNTYYATLSDRSISTRNNYVSILKGFFQYLMEVQVIDKDPTVVLRCVKDKRDDSIDEEEMDAHIYSTETLVAMLESESGRNKVRNKAIIAMLIASGLRASELCSLDIRQFRGMKAGRIYVMRKGGAYKWTDVAEFAMGYVEAYLATRPSATDDDPLFITSHGNRMTRVDVWRSLATKQKAEGVPTGVHRFRHTFLTAAERVGGPVAARDLGNHAHLKTTGRYLHTDALTRQEVVNNLPWGGKC